MRTVMKWSVVAFTILACGFECCSAQEFRPYIRFPHATAAVSANWSVPAICQAYSFPRNLAGGGVIGILELGGGFKQSDLDTFSSLYGMPKITATAVSVNGGQNRTGSDSDFEVALDIQVAAAAYYYSTGKMPTIKVFFAPNSTASFAAVVNAAVANGCDVLSISWGAPEKLWGRSSLTSLESTIASAATKGLIVFSASGDNSSSDGSSGTNVDAPACCPHVVGCGGTTKTTSTETVWGTGSATALGTGGGYSMVFGVQSFQVGAPTGAGRMVPDVAANADPNTGYIIVVRGTRYLIGGTSAVAPLYSGLFAASGKKLGFVTPKLWQNPSDFTDIKTGSIGAYSAKTGPDACTGLGAPKGVLIASLFSASSSSSTAHVFNVAAVGSSQSVSPFQLSVEHALEKNVLTAVDGKLPSLPGDYAALIFDNSKGKSSIFGLGGELNLGGLNLFLFSGNE